MGEKSGEEQENDKVGRSVHPGHSEGTQKLCKEGSGLVSDGYCKNGIIDSVNELNDVTPEKNSPFSLGGIPIGGPVNANHGDKTPPPVPDSKPNQRER